MREVSGDSEERKLCSVRRWQQRRMASEGSLYRGRIERRGLDDVANSHARGCAAPSLTRRVKVTPKAARSSPRARMHGLIILRTTLSNTLFGRAAIMPARRPAPGSAVTNVLANPYRVCCSEYRPGYPWQCMETKMLVGRCRAAALLFVCPCMLVSCASISTQIDPNWKVAGTANDPGVSDGIIYYMPQRPIKVTIAWAAGSTAAAGSKNSATPHGTPTVDTLNSLPDLSRRFLLSYDNFRNLFGKNHANIKINTNGLLTSVGGDTTSGIIDIVKNVAKSLGSIAAASKFAVAAAGETRSKPVQCQAGLSYTRLFFLYKGDTQTADDETICGFTVRIVQADGQPVPKFDALPDGRNPGDTVNLNKPNFQSGVFYRQDIPYRVIVTDSSGNKSQFIAYSPSLSPIGYAPFPQTVFADNNTTMSLTNGVLTGVETTISGELAALTELPADFISAYATAVGGIFSQIGTNYNNESALNKSRASLAQSDVQYQICRAAIIANDAAISLPNFQGKTGADLTAALNTLAATWASIKGVCAS